MRGKKTTKVIKKRFNQKTAAATARQGASAGTAKFHLPKRVINNILSAMKSLEKAQLFLNPPTSGRRGKTKIVKRRAKSEAGDMSPA